MQNVKGDWTDRITEVLSDPYGKLLKVSAIWIDRRKLVLGNKLFIKDGMILTEKECPDSYTHYVVGLESTLNSSKHRITLESLSTNLIETIDL